jgi:hypothetical protein
VVDARIENEKLVAKTGIKTIEVPIARLQHLYVHHPRDAQLVELLLSYVHKGRLKRARIYSDPGQANFDRLVKMLLTRRPEIDISHIDVHQAYVRMGSRELEWVVIPAVMGVGLLIVTILFAPMLLHGFDRGHAEVTVSQLASGVPLDTHHLTVIGTAQVERLVRADTRQEAHQKRAVVWVPLVSPGSPPDTPADVILESRIGPGDLEALGEADRFQGLLRNIWWEGLDGAQRKALIAGGVRLSSDPKLLAHRVTPRDELTISAMIVGFLSLILIIVTRVLWKNGHRPSA